MSIETSDVEKIAHLARLHLEPSQSAAVTASIANILALIDTMQEVATDAVPPLAHTSTEGQRLRADVVTEVNDRDHLQQIAPSTENGLYLVPRVIE
ncbi:MAG: Asp-tRNA(Asn)/Glu-tRNA(Gln) amidotransferase subunit GatC [Pseudomonadales bacterium]|nr:Asp-tRNA(Asn)/Glu-tRNA(Gln) amidotransferase subunit GatC [Pseudomonadales bacterium]